MKRLSPIVIALAVFAASCDDDSPTSPSAANTIGLFSNLLPGNEVPPVTNADASASGTVSIVLNLTRDGSGAITAATATFQVSMTGFPANTALTGAHIHQAPAGVVANPKISTGLASRELVLANGSGSFTKSGINVSPTDAQGLIDNPAGYYFNVHTPLNPGGAIRGQLSRTN